MGDSPYSIRCPEPNDVNAASTEGKSETHSQCRFWADVNKLGSWDVVTRVTNQVIVTYNYLIKVLITVPMKSHEPPSNT